jgi:uncharacterized membrane protein
MSSAAHTRSLFVAAEAFLSFAGAGIAGTLWWADQTRQDVPCSADGGCAIVSASRWSHLDLIVFHQVPVALLGLIGYVLLLSLAMLRLGSEDVRLDRRLHLLIGLISAGGAGYSWFLQWIAHADIGAFCIWCRSSAIVMTLLFCTAAAEWAAGRRQSLERQKING